MQPRYVVGIDLGTTHTVLAAAALAGDSLPAIVALPQTRVLGTEAYALWPSVLYAPAEGEASVAELPHVTLSAGADAYGSGHHARDRADDVPGRALVSSKSWLSQRLLDPLAAHLPWGGAEGTPKLSAMHAQAVILRDVAAAWNSLHPAAPLAEQQVVITVPASFDPSARALVQQAAQLAGLGAVQLVEEPLAAFYACVRDARNHALQESSGVVLVVDIGGGTTDLSLIQLAQGAELAATRTATGAHLLLGGDNLDVALATQLEAQFPRGAELDAGLFAQLVARARHAKEQLLSADPPREIRVDLARRGSQLVGNTLHGKLVASAVRALLFEGFFPAVGADAQPDRSRGGLVATGLAYERDAAVTRHLARFLSEYAGAAPSWLLVNGGMFHAHGLREHLRDIVAGWTGVAAELPAAVQLDGAVALGAVWHGLAALGLGARVRTQVPRTLLLRVALAPEEFTSTGALSATSSAEPPLAGIVLLPRGALEGAEHAQAKPMWLSCGETARFEVFAVDSPAAFMAGERHVFAASQCWMLPPLFTLVTGRGEVAVRVSAQLAEDGSLALACVRESGQRHVLAFRSESVLSPERNSRVPGPRVSLPPPARMSTAPRELRSAPPPALEAVSARISKAFGKPATQRDVVDLPRDLDKLLGARETWSLDVLRGVADHLLAHRAGRQASQDAERVFFSLVGYCVRPGFGAPGDELRVRALAGLLPHRLAFADRTPGWQSFFIAYRRIAAGLSGDLQRELYQTYGYFLFPKQSGRKAPKFTALGLPELRTLLASLEHLAPEFRAELGQWVVERTYVERTPALFADLGKLGARVPAYANSAAVLAPKLVEGWLQELLRQPWDGIATLPPAALSMARMTGDKARDLSLQARDAVAKRLTQLNVSADILAPLHAVVELAEREALEFYGDHLPLGLRVAT